jgi:O-antigen ligase
MQSTVSDIASIRLSKLLLWVGPAVTLVVNPWTNYDPISLPKMLVLSIFACAVLGLLISSRQLNVSKIPKSIFILLAIFLAGLTLSFAFSGAPLNQQLWGSFGRNTGFLTYLSFAIIMISVSQIQNVHFYLELCKTLMWTSIPMTAYCVIQYFGEDPIPWSEKGVFGTLGNINFLSAFLGMTSIMFFIQALNPSLRPNIRVFFFLKILLDLFLIYSTGSIQGPMIFLAGVVIFGYLLILRFNSWKIPFLVTYSAIVVTLGSLVILGLRNLGPLAKFLFQPSVLFRQDYWHAGWQMTVDKPLFGVGLDSYGDWYREVRGELSTLRTGPGRVSNTAHNVFLDISATGGVIPGMSYALFVLLIFVFSARSISKAKQPFSIQSMVFCAWCAYQIQALVSINQIGIGIWGWLLSGALIGMISLSKYYDSMNIGFSITRRGRKHRHSNLNARDSLTTTVGAIIGFLIAIMPLQADASYRSASSKGQIGEMRKVTLGLGATQFHRELVLDFAMRGNLVGETKTIAEELVQDYPRNYFGWRILSVSTASTENERLIALQRARALDPFNPELG